MLEMTAKNDRIAAEQAEADRRFEAAQAAIAKAEDEADTLEEQAIMDAAPKLLVAIEEMLNVLDTIDQENLSDADTDAVVKALAIGQEAVDEALGMGVDL